VSNYSHNFPMKNLYDRINSHVLLRYLTQCLAPVASCIKPQSVLFPPSETKFHIRIKE